MFEMQGKLFTEQIYKGKTLRRTVTSTYMEHGYLLLAQDLRGSRLLLIIPTDHLVDQTVG